MKRSGSVCLCGFFVLLVVSVLVIAAPTSATAETATILWEGNVTLTNETTFTYVPYDNASGSYTVNITTDLGALTATGLAFNASDRYHASMGTFWIDSIGGIENEPWVAGVSRSWAIFVNDVAASMGLGGNELEDGDNVKFYFCPSDPNTYAPLTENASYLVNITVNVVDILFEGTVMLKNETTFTYVPSNNASASYVVNTTTDLGALTATGLAFNASDTWYASYGTFWLESIAGIENEVWPSSTWCIYINDAPASMGLGGNVLEDGDNVKFYFCPANATTYAYITENASYLVNINVTVQEVLFEGTVTLTNGTTFSFVPSNNASASYVVNTTTDLGALTATGLTFNASDTWYASYGTFWLESIAGIENEVWPSNTWCIYINDAPASKGLGGNVLEDGDNVKFYFCPANATTYAYITENASYLVNINVNVTALPTPTPTPTPAPYYPSIRGGGAPKDSDGDGYSDIQEDYILGTDKDDPCDPDPECAACLASQPVATPTPTPTPTPTVTPTPTIPSTVATPTPAPIPTTKPRISGFEAILAIAGLLAVAYLVLSKKRK